MDRIEQCIGKWLRRCWFCGYWSFWGDNRMLHQPPGMPCACRWNYPLLPCLSSFWLQKWVQPLWYYQTCRFTLLCSLNLQGMEHRAATLLLRQPWLQGTFIPLFFCFLFFFFFPPLFSAGLYLSFVLPPANLSIIAFPILMLVYPYPNLVFLTQLPR